MKQLLPKSFRSQLIAVIIVSTVLPALVVAGLLLLQIQQNAQENVVTKLDLQLKSDADIIQSEILLVSSLLKQLALDQNNILAAENSVFSVYARNQLFAVIEAHPEIKLVQIYDTQLWPVESVPLNYEFMSLDFLFVNFPQLDNESPKAHMRVFEDDTLTLLLNEHSTVPVHFNEYLAISVPLFKANESNPAQPIRTGVLFALVYLQDLLQLLDTNSTYSISLQPINAVSLEENESIIVHTTQLPVGQQSIHLGIEYSRAQLVGPINRAYQIIWLIIMVILVTSIYISVYFSRRFTRPFENISQLIESYRQGKFESKCLELNFEEFIHMSEVLEDMASIIDKNRHELEDRVEQRTQELAEANESLKNSLETQRNMQTHLIESEKMAQLGGLVAGISHEVNTPIGIGLTAASSMRVFVNEIQQLTESGKLTRAKHENLINKCLECADIVVSNLSRSADLISNFKDVAVSQSSSEATDFNLLEFMQEIVNSLIPQTKKYQLNITLDIDENLVMRSYQGVIAQIFTNFIINSIKHGFTPDKPHNILIHAYIERNGLKLDYQDDGSGMDKEVLAKIFEPFYTTKRGQGGTGLGMHIVYNLITQKLDGRITAQSRGGKGAKFKISLPNFHIAKNKNVLP